MPQDLNDDDDDDVNKFSVELYSRG